jgi:ABC-type antimicrobial peptide transport system permease subunit
MDWSGSKVRWGKPLPDSSDSGSSSSIVVSQKYLDFLGGGDPTKYIGKKTILDITLSKGLMTDNKNKVLADKEFTIVGVLQDNAGATVNTNYQNLTTEGVTNFSQMKVEISDRSKVTNTRMQIENLGLKTQYVGDTVNQIDQVFSIFKVILGGFGLIALGVAALGMFNTLTISLMERIREVALMKILGMRKRDIHNIFITEAVFLGTFGGIVGILLGYLESLLANSVLNRIAIAAGGEPVNIFYLPIWFIFVVILFALSVGLLTGLYPARRASRVNALDVMRYE